MKEATGEANMTIITIVLVGMVLGMVGLVLVQFMGQTSDKTKCNNCGGYWNDGACYKTEDFTGGTYSNYETCQ